MSTNQLIHFNTHFVLYTLLCSVHSVLLSSMDPLKGFLYLKIKNKTLTNHKNYVLLGKIRTLKIIIILYCFKAFK